MRGNLLCVGRNEGCNEGQDYSRHNIPYCLCFNNNKKKNNQRELLLDDVSEKKRGMPMKMHAVVTAPIGV